MEGISLVESKALESMMHRFDDLENRVTAALDDLKDSKKAYLTMKETAELMGFSEVWVCNNKQDIGYSNIGRTIRFKRKDVEAYMDSNYFKAKKGK